MDGIRVYWDGQKLWTRQGLEVVATEITSALPSDIKLDGELWMGRGSFHQLVSQFQSNEEPLELAGDVRLAVIDVPSQTTKSHKDRITVLQHVIFPPQVLRYPGAYYLQVFVVPHFVCESNHQIIEELQHVLEVGGEGLIANNPDSLYHRGRTASVLKIKVVLLFD